MRAAGITDAGKALVTSNGAGRHSEEVARLAGEAKAALGGYYREFLLAKPTGFAWEPSCDHEPRAIPATVLDPFAGSGTVGLVADRHGRDAILIEISAEYAELARKRIADLFAKVTVA